MCNFFKFVTILFISFLGIKRLPTNQSTNAKITDFKTLFTLSAAIFNFAACFLKTANQGVRDFVAEKSQDWMFRLSWNFQERFISLSTVFWMKRFFKIMNPWFYKLKIQFFEVLPPDFIFFKKKNSFKTQSVNSVTILPNIKI